MARDDRETLTEEMGQPSQVQPSTGLEADLLGPGPRRQRQGREWK